MFKKLIIICMGVLFLAPAAFADHYRVDARVLMKVSTMEGTPGTEMAKQLSVMKRVNPNLWLGVQGCTTEDGDEVLGPYGEGRIGTIYTTKAGTLLDLGAYGYWDVNGANVEDAFDFAEGSLGLLVRVLPAGAKWTMMLSVGVDGYTDFVETLVRVSNDKSEHDSDHEDEFETVITSEGAQALEVGFSMGFSF